MARVNVHVTPKGGADSIVGWRGGELQVRVSAAPEHGKANLSVCKLVAKALGVPKGSVTVVLGETSRHKVIEVPVDEARLREVLGSPTEGCS